MADNNVNNRRDIISTLPSEYLGYIFSFLPFKDAARTSLLSTRFRNVWRGMGNVDFQESEFVNQDDNEENRQNQRRDFIEIACQWVENYKGTTLDKFSFTFSRPGDFPEGMQDLVMFSTARKAKKINLDFHDPLWREDVAQNHEGVFHLPLHFYGHKDLESLKLFACNLLVSEFKNFCALKELSLGWVELGANSVKTLLLYCPSLESFSMKKCWSIDGHLDVSRRNSGLKTLVLDKCNFVAGLIQIEAPTLRFFKYSGKVDSFHFERRLLSLQEAEIDFGLEFEFSEVGALLYDLLENLFSVRVLTVCSYLLQVVPTAEEPLGLKNTLNVRHLILKTSLHPFEFYGIRFMLRSCPLLETLTINIGRARIFSGYVPPFKLDPQDFWVKNLVVFKCIKKTLKVVEVTGFKGTVNEFLFLQYLICLGGVLEKVNIYLSEEVDGHGGNRETYLQRAQWMQSQLKKASKNLSISIY